MLSVNKKRDLHSQACKSLQKHSVKIQIKILNQSFTLSGSSVVMGGVGSDTSSWAEQ